MQSIDLDALALDPAEESKQKINARLKQVFATLNEAHQDIFTHWTWGNASHTAQDLFDQYGAAAAHLFYLGSLNVFFLAAIKASPEKWTALRSDLETLMVTHQLQVPLPPEHWMPPLPFTIHEDGTVTVQSP